MRGFIVLLAGLQAGAAGSSAGSAQEGTEASYSATDRIPPVRTADQLPQQFVRPCLGAGYVPYAYPGFETCPCGGDSCFHPAWYYCGGEPYRKRWWRTWLGAHVGRGSMLERHPCDCVFPGLGRPVLQTVPPAGGGQPDTNRPQEPQSSAAPAQLR